MHLFHSKINPIGFSFETDKFSPDLSAEEFIKILITDIDINYLECKGDVSSVKYMLPGCIRYSYWTDKELKKKKKLMPAGLSITRATSDHYNAGDSNRLVIDVTISSEYVRSIDRSIYYSEEFASRLINNRSEELKAMLTKVNRHSSCKIDDIGIQTSMDNPDRHSVLFESFNLKPLTTFSQRYTLAKVLADCLNKDNPDWESSVELKTYFNEGYDAPYDLIPGFVVILHQKYKEIPQPPKVLSDW